MYDNISIISQIKNVCSASEELDFLKFHLMFDDLKTLLTTAT